MINAELTRYIRKEIERQMNVILSGVAGNATEQTEDVQQLFPSMPTITQRPVMHPFGLSSAAPDNTLSVVAKQGEHIGNRIVLGHRDKNKPSTAKGEVVLYDQFGRTIELREKGMLISNPNGTFAAKSNGQELMEILERLLITIINAKTNTILGPQPLIPDPTREPERETFIHILEDLHIFSGEEP